MLFWCHVYWLEHSSIKNQSYLLGMLSKCVKFCVGALGVFRVMRYINVQYLLTYLDMCPYFALWFSDMKGIEPVKSPCQQCWKVLQICAPGLTWTNFCINRRVKRKRKVAFVWMWVWSVSIVISISRCGTLSAEFQQSRWHHARLNHLATWQPWRHRFLVQAPWPLFLPGQNSTVCTIMLVTVLALLCAS